MLEFGASLLDGEWPNRPWLRWAARRMARSAAFTTPAAARPGGLRVASRLRPPRLLHGSRFTKVAIGVSGVMERRDNAALVNTPTCRQLRHSTVTVGSARNTRSDIPAKIGRLLALSESTHNGLHSTDLPSKAADERPAFDRRDCCGFVLATNAARYIGGVIPSRPKTTTVACHAPSACFSQRG